MIKALSDTYNKAFGINIQVGPSYSFGSAS